MSIHIDRCVCFDQPLTRLVEVARASGAATLEELQRHVEFGARCRLCHPYVRRALATGETVFREILPKKDH